MNWGRELISPHHVNKIIEFAFAFVSILRITLCLDLLLSSHILLVLRAKHESCQQRQPLKKRNVSVPIYCEGEIVLVFLVYFWCSN